MNTLKDAEAFAGQYITIGKGKTVWFVERVSNTGLHCSASVPGRVVYKRVPMEELDRANLWTPEAPAEVEEAPIKEMSAAEFALNYPAGTTQQWDAVITDSLMEQSKQGQSKQWAVEYRDTGYLAAERFSTQEEAQAHADKCAVETAVRFIPTREDVATAVEEVKAEILADIAKGIQPADVPDFSTLHDYVDANEYGGFCDEDRRAHWDTDALAMMQDVVNKWLMERTPVEEGECYVCDKVITEADEDRGQVFMDEGNGPAVDVCSDRCGDAFYNVDEDQWEKFPKAE